MTEKTIIQTEQAPQAIGTYSQAVKAGDTVYLSGQIPLDPASGELVSENLDEQIDRVFANIGAVAKAAGGGLQDIVKLNIYLTDLANFPKINEAMSKLFKEPYPARAAVQVSALPKSVDVEVDGVMVV